MIDGTLLVLLAALAIAGWGQARYRKGWHAGRAALLREQERDKPREWWPFSDTLGRHVGPIPIFDPSDPGPIETVEIVPAFWHFPRRSHRGRPRQEAE